MRVPSQTKHDVRCESGGILSAPRVTARLGAPTHRRGTPWRPWEAGAARWRSTTAQSLPPGRGPPRPEPPGTRGSQEQKCGKKGDVCGVPLGYACLPPVVSSWHQQLELIKTSLDSFPPDAFHGRPQTEGVRCGPAAPVLRHRGWDWPFSPLLPPEARGALSACRAAVSRPRWTYRSPTAQGSGVTAEVLSVLPPGLPGTQHRAQHTPGAQQMCVQQVDRKRPSSELKKGGLF